MHQPYYKNLETGEHVMPWVRLHGTKDYLDMPLVVEECQGMKATFNLVPSLLTQIEEYVKGTAKERSLLLSEKAASELDFEERRYIIENFFLCNHDRMIAPFPRYEELYASRGWAHTREEIDRVANYFSPEDIRDLQVLFNLAWIDPLIREREPFLKELCAKGSHFTEEEKRRLLEVIQRLMGEIIPTYRRLQEANIIEVSVSPFYHPILPLLYDTDFGQRPRSETPLPRVRFHQPGEAVSQIKTACEFYTRHFGIPPRGMWPSEGSVCPEIIPLISSEGISWIATDEEILALSLGDETFKRDAEGFLPAGEAEILYQPYRAIHQDSEAIIFFRDHFLSDLIGFQYAGWEPDTASEDFVSRLKKIHAILDHKKGPYIVPVILDGENCWEFYRDDGPPFLRSLYRKIVDDPGLEPTTPSEFLAKHRVKTTLAELFTGSWINHDFHIWIGHEDDRVSWERLAQTYKDVSRRLLDPDGGLSEESIGKAKKALAVAEGSDWNWWYGDDHYSGMDDKFDSLYRSHLKEAYRALGLEVPSRLFVPIMGQTPGGQFQEPRAFLKPIIDGKDTSYFEWLAAGCYEISSGSMHRSQHAIQRLYYGFDAENLYFRIDPNPDIFSLIGQVPFSFILAILEPLSWRIKVKIDPSSNRNLQAQCYAEKENGAWAYVFSLDRVAFDRILELAVPFPRLGLKPKMVIHFQVMVQSRNRDIERCPAGIPIRLILPDHDFEKSLWMV